MMPATAGTIPASGCSNELASPATMNHVISGIAANTRPFKSLTKGLRDDFTFCVLSFGVAVPFVVSPDISSPRLACNRRHHFDAAHE